MTAATSAVEPGQDDGVRTGPSSPRPAVPSERYSRGAGERTLAGPTIVASAW